MAVKRDPGSGARTSGCGNRDRRSVSGVEGESVARTHFLRRGTSRRRAGRHSVARLLAAAVCERSASPRTVDHARRLSVYDYRRDAGRIRADPSPHAALRRCLDHRGGGFHGGRVEREEPSNDRVSGDWTPASWRDATAGTGGIQFAGERAAARRQALLGHGRGRCQCRAGSGRESTTGSVRPFCCCRVCPIDRMREHCGTGDWKAVRPAARNRDSRGAGRIARPGDPRVFEGEPGYLGGWKRCRPPGGALAARPATSSFTHSLRSNGRSPNGRHSGVVRPGIVGDKCLAVRVTAGDCRFPFRPELSPEGESWCVFHAFRASRVGGGAGSRLACHGGLAAEEPGAIAECRHRLRNAPADYGYASAAGDILRNARCGGSPWWMR